MFPPVEESILQNNPGFAKLYSTLTNDLLNPDVSTKNDPAAKERKAVRKELDRYRLKAAKQSLLTHALATATPNDQSDTPKPTIATRRATRSHPQSTRSIANQAKELPPDLLDLLLLLPPFLISTSPYTQQRSPQQQGQPLTLTPEQTITLLSSPPFSTFPTHLPHLSQIISQTLHASVVQLARIAFPTVNPSFVHRSIPSLPNHAANLLASITEAKANLTKSRLKAASDLTKLLSLNHDVLVALIRALESKHGPIARSLEFRAHEAALLAQKQEAEAQVKLLVARRDTYTPEVTFALGNYTRHLRDGQARLREAIRGLRGELGLYGVVVDDGGDPADGEDTTKRRTRSNTARTGANMAKGSYAQVGQERTMRELARVYREMLRQVDEVRADLERLGKA